MLWLVAAAGQGWQVPRVRAASVRRAGSIGLQIERTGDTFFAVIELGEGEALVSRVASRTHQPPDAAIAAGSPSEASAVR